MQPFDPARLAKRLGWGHGGRLGIAYQAHGPDWVEMTLPFSPDHIGADTIAAGPIMTLMDMAASLAIWTRRGGFLPHATLDLRLDRLRPPAAERTLIGRASCYHLTPAVAFVRGEAHDGDPAAPVAHVTGTFMLMDAA